MLTAAGTLSPRKAFGAPVLRNLMDITFYLGFVVVYAVTLARAASPCPNIIFIFYSRFPKRLQPLAEDDSTAHAR